MKKSFSKPVDKFEWAAVIGGMFFLIAYLYRILTDNYADASVLESKLKWVFLQPAEFAGYALMVCGLVTGGIRGIRISGFSLKFYTNLVCGIILILAPLLVCTFFSHTWLPEMINTYKISPSVLADMEEQLKKGDLNNKKKAFASLAIAREQYIFSGKIVPVFDIYGNLVIYRPTASDKDVVGQISVIKSYISEFLIYICFYCFILICSVAVGLLLPGKKHQAEVTVEACDQVTDENPE
ncbi:MAG: hypothetical protein GY749_48760 [Desulfobacteraceae bacterium]|nr:hypothetical protein [Desulfobacteraceae bacterium]